MSANAIQMMLREQQEYKSYKGTALEAEEDDDQEWAWYCFAVCLYLIVVVRMSRDEQVAAQGTKDSSKFDAVETSAPEKPYML